MMKPVDFIGMSILEALESHFQGIDRPYEAWTKLSSCLVHKMKSKFIKTQGMFPHIQRMASLINPLV